MTIVAGCLPAPPSGPAVVTGVTQRGIVANPTAPQFLRDGAASARVGSKIVWAFGDSYVAGLGHPEEWSSTAALADPSNPLVLSEPTTGDPVRYASRLVSPSAADDAWRAMDPERRFVKYWPASVIPEVGNNSAVVFSDHFWVENLGTPEDLDLVSTPKGLHLGLLSSGGDTTADHVDEFTGAAARFHHGVFLDTSVSPLDQYVYLYDCSGGSPADAINGTLPLCKVARAARTDMRDVSAYEYWNGTAWVADVDDAVPTVPGGGAGFDIQWNDHLDSYVSVVPRSKFVWNDLNGDGEITTDELTGSFHTIELRRASSPVAPADQWTAPVTLCGTTAASFDVCEWTIQDLADNGVPYAWRIHPALSASDGSTIAVSYHEPSSSQVRVLDVQLG